MANHVPLVEKIRRRLDAGELPSEHPPKLLSRYGKRETCSACDQQIYRAQVMYELEMPGTEQTYRLHTGCYGLWTAELIHRGLYKPE